MPLFFFFLFSASPTEEILLFFRPSGVLLNADVVFFFNIYIVLFCRTVDNIIVPKNRLDLRSARSLSHYKCIRVESR